LYTLSSNDGSGVNQVSQLDTTAAIYSASVTTPIVGVTRIVYTRTVAAGTYSGALAIPGPGETGYLMYAMGNSPTLALHVDQGVCAFDFWSGGSCSPISNAGLILGHGVLMFLAWGLLAPLGVMIARYAKMIPPTSDKTPSKYFGAAVFWFRSHWMLQAAAWFFSLIGFILALVLASPGPHFDSIHSRIGLFVILLGFIQPLNAYIRPKGPAPGKARTGVRFAWELWHKGSGYMAIFFGPIAIFLGFQLAQASSGIVAAFSILVTIGILFAGWREYISWTRQDIPTSKASSMVVKRNPVATEMSARSVRVAASSQRINTPSSKINTSSTGGARV
jgi:Eukaryotic cytochrome b561